MAFAAVENGGTTMADLNPYPLGDLIEREEVLRTIDNAGCYGHSFETLYDEVANIKAVDAVTVIRCKDCKHYKEFRTKRYRQLMRMCCRQGKYDGEFHVKEDDFCSYGERRADNATD